MKTSNDEISGLFLQLFDFASIQGASNLDPTLAKRLESAARRIRSQGDDTFDDGESPDSESISSRGLDLPKAILERANQITPPYSEHDNMLRDYKAMIPGEVAEPFEDVDLLGDASLQDQSNNLQIITRPSADNASFLFDFANFSRPYGETTPTDVYTQMLTAQPNPPSPASVATSESSFARLVQRRSAEAALRFVTSPNPNPVIWNRVFGMTLMYDSKPQIIARLKRVLESTSTQSLEQWRQPFVHLGGSGTHYPMREQDISGVPQFQTGYSMGPFSPLVTQFQDKLQDGFMMDGFPFAKEIYFDPNDVECYLQTLGIEISPTADYVHADLDLDHLQRNSEDGTSQYPIRKSARVDAQNSPQEFGNNNTANFTNFDARLIGNSGGMSTDSSNPPFLMYNEASDNQLSETGETMFKPSSVTIDVTKLVNGKSDIANAMSFVPCAN